MKKKNLKIGLIILLVMLMLGLTYTSFAFWDQLTKTDDITVDIGEGKEITQLVSTTRSGKKLIPSSGVLGTGEVHEITETFTVTLDNEVLNPLNLSVTYENVKVGGVEDTNNLIKIVITQSSPTIQKGTDVTGTVKITFNNEPADETAYNAIRDAVKNNREITFTLRFAATQ